MLNTKSSEVVSLMNSLLSSPGEDIIRLMLADALEEEGTEESIARARFIRTMFEMYAIGEPRKTISARLDFHAGKCFATASREDRIKTGDRIDLESPEGLRHVRIIPGLLVVKTEPDDAIAGTVRLTLVADEHSKPYQEQKKACLYSECYKYLMDYPHWQPKRDYVGKVEVFQYDAILHLKRRVAAKGIGDRSGVLHWEKGFVSRFVGSWESWTAVADTITRTLPIYAVELTTHLDDNWGFREGLDYVVQYPKITEWKLPAPYDEDR